MIEFTPKKKGSLGKNYLYRCTAFGLRRRASSPALRAGEGPPIPPQGVCIFSIYPIGKSIFWGAFGAVFLFFPLFLPFFSVVQDEHSKKCSS